MRGIFDGEELPEVEERSVVRQTVDEVRRNNTWAVRIQVALIALMVAAVIVSLAFTVLALQRGNEQRRAVLELTRVIQTYNQEHARQAERSFRSLHEAGRCAILKLFTGEPFEQVHPEEVAACYQPIEPAPPAPTVTTRG